MRDTIVALAASGGDLNLRGVELSVIQKLGCLGSRLLLEGYGGILSSVVGLGDLYVRDLAAVEADGLVRQGLMMGVYVALTRS
ncbi:hypothetical protein RRF57_011100 [Xylaria bambusicola]|uniref:Uncharacterized protein n=1 Tax=Xylaria bambusicola TaxID=326684 RepID=A0AAN7UXK7_9PEZI